MDCVQISAGTADSEMEEGEIIDEIDDNSDISSEEEFLLRQRLQVLESYNNVLERKKAKRTPVGSGTEYHKNNAICELSEISGTDVDDGFSREVYRLPKKQKVQTHHKHNKSKQTGRENGKVKEHKKKNHHYKKRSEIKVVSETSESEDDYRNKRRKLASAVALNKNKTDTSTLKDRLTKMLCGNKSNLHIETEVSLEVIKSSEIQKIDNSSETLRTSPNVTIKSPIKHELIDLCTDEDTNIEEVSHNAVDTITVKEDKTIDMLENSDEDIEQLRQHALQTKSSKITKNAQLFTNNKHIISSDDEDSDTADLRMICLRSALLKKAIEMKQKQKKHKRLSQSSGFENDCNVEPNNQNNDTNNYENNTDIESVDMDIASDGAEKVKDFSYDGVENNVVSSNDVNKIFSEQKEHQSDEIEEDEDLLRAKLLTSLSKNLPNLVDFNIINNVLKESEKTSNNVDVSKQPNVQNEKKFIIQLGESDSEGEHEATKNLTKMHIKLSEQEDFQHKLDLFLKSSRMQVEQNILPDVVQPQLQKVQQKFVPKEMNHLPKSEQIEYKNLVKRMAELEKMKQVRQNILAYRHTFELDENKSVKDTLKPHNVTLNTKNNIINKLDERIALSRKKIAEESAKMLKLREEAKKLSQRYKIAATELRNITTAITLNKKQQRAIQNGLFKVRLHHQMLLKSSTNIKQSEHISMVNQPTSKISANKSQKENDPSTPEQIEKKQKQQEYKDPNMLKTVKVSVVNDLNKDTITTHPRLSVQVDITNNKKTIKLPKPVTRNRTVVQQTGDSNKNISNNKRSSGSNSTDSNTHNGVTEDGGGTLQLPNLENISNNTELNVNDYKSPLEALNNKNWEEDPNAFLCPFEVGGSCRDTDCKYLHPKVPSRQ